MTTSPTSDRARRAPCSRLALLLAAAAAGVLAGCGDLNLSAPAPPIPALTAAVAVTAEPPRQVAWEGEAITLRVTGTNLRDPAAPGGPVRLTATRVSDLDGRLVRGPERSGLVQVVARDGAETASLDLDGAALAPGSWRVAVQDDRGRLAVLERALVVLARPALTGGGLLRACPPGGGRMIRLEGRELPFWSGAVPGWPQVVLREGGHETTLAVVGRGGCTSAYVGPGLLERCTSLDVMLPEGAATVAGDLALRFPGAEAALAGQPPTTRLLAESAASAPQAQLLSALDGPASLVVRSGAPALLGPGAMPAAWLDGQPLTLAGQGCAPGADPAVARCDALVATIPQGSAPGAHQVTLETAAGCASTIDVTLVPRPVITGLTPAAVCQGRYEALVISGTGVGGGHPVYSAGGTGPWTPFRTNWPGDLPVGRHLVALEYLSTPPVRSEPVWLDVFPGPLVVSDWTSPGLVWSGATRPVTVWLGALGGPPSARLLPDDGGPPVPVALTSAGQAWSFDFPALGGSTSYQVEITDQSPCGAATVPPRLATQADPSLLAWAFDPDGGSPVLVGPDGVAVFPGAAVTPGAGVSGAAATAALDTPAGGWYVAWAPSLSAADYGLLRFDLKASGAGAPSAAPGLRLFVSEHSGHRLVLERALPPPAPDAWTHYEVRLDDPAGCTAVEPLGTQRPCLPADLSDRIETFEILGGWWSGPVQAAIDDLSLELAR